MADSSPADALRGRTVVLAGEAGALRDQAAACLVDLGAWVVNVGPDGAVGLDVADLKTESQVSVALDRVAAAVGRADAVIFVGRDLRDGEQVANFIEESIASYHFHLKLAKRLRVQAATDVVALSGAPAADEEAALAADIRNGSLRQMSLVAASEGGPLRPPLLANAVIVSSQPTGGAQGAPLSSKEPSASLAALLARLLARPQGYVTGTSLSVAL